MRVITKLTQLLGCACITLGLAFLLILILASSPSFTSYMPSSPPRPRPYDTQCEDLKDDAEQLEELLSAGLKTLGGRAALTVREQARVDESERILKLYRDRCE